LGLKENLAAPLPGKKMRFCSSLSGKTLKKQ